jgi:hypothetical protein
MKNISKNEVFAGLFIIIVLFVLGSAALNETISSLKTFGINLYEVLFAKHIAWFVVRGILALFASAGIWLGSAKSKLLFSGVLFVIVASFF